MIGVFVVPVLLASSSEDKTTIAIIDNNKFNKEVMIAGNIKFNDNLENLKEIADIIDISGGLETYGLKDISKIETFLNNVKKLNDET